MDENFKSLKGIGVFSSELVFDEDEISIQRHLSSLIINIALSMGLILSGTLYIINAFVEQLFSWFFYFQVIVTFSISILLIVIIFLYIDYRKKNRKNYTYNEIKRFETKEINTFIRLKFEFTDNSKDVIKLYRNKKSRDFIKFLKSKTSISEN